MKRKMKAKKTVALGLSLLMLSSSTGTWAESVQTSELAQETQETTVEELTLQADGENQEAVTDALEVSAQMETLVAETEVAQYPEEVSIYPQENLTTAAEALPETVLESTVESILPAETLPEESVSIASEDDITQEDESSIAFEESVESTEIQTTIESLEYSTEETSEQENESEAETELESEFESESETQELELFEEPETDGYLEDALVEGDFKYQVIDDQATITGYIGNGGVVAVPEKIGEYTVVGIGSNAFAVNSITSLIIPQSVTKLGYDIIKGSKIESITIPSGVTICEKNLSNGNDDGPLTGAQFLVEVIFEEKTQKIPEYIAYNTNALMHVVIPDTVTEIGEWAFAKTSKLQQIELQENLVKIASRAFYQSNLRTITIPKTVIRVGDSAFMESKITRVEFLKGDRFTRKIIDSGAFKACINLTEVMLCENIIQLGDQVFSGCEKLRELQIPESVVRLGQHIIEGTKISNITIPKDVVEASIALAGAKFLKKIIFEYGIEKIPSRIASSVDVLEQVDIPESVIEIESQAFDGASQLKQIKLPDSLEKIQSDAFRDSGLENLIIPKNVTLVGQNAFSNSQLTSVEFEEGDEYIQTSIENYAFYGCKKLKDITMSENIIKIGMNIISGTIIESITIPKGVKRCTYDSQGYGYAIKGSPLMGAKYLAEIIFENGMTEIPAYIAAGAESLKRVEIPETVTTIGYGAFRGTYRLQNVELPEKLMVIGSASFDDSGITNIVIPSKVTNVYSYAFASSKLEKVIFEEDDENTKTEIGYWVFGSCSALKDLILSDNIVSIEGGLIYGTQIKSLTIPSSLKTCAGGFGPLSQGNALKELIFEEGLEEIPAAIAYGASSLERIIIPQTVTKIASSAFPPNGNFVIYGMPNSYAETYAKEHNIPFNANAGEYYPGLYTESDYIVRVIDSSSKKPIKNVRITIGGEEFGISDANGFVKINCFATETQQIKLSRNGYKPIRYTGMPWSSTSENVVEMQSAVEYESAIKEMFTQTKLGQSTLYGPQISMFGQDFNLFEAKVSFDFPFLKDLVVKFDEQSQTVKVLIGFDDEYKAELKDSPTNGKYWSESYQQVKSLVKACGGKVDTPKLWNQFSKLRGKLKKAQGTAAFGVSGEVTGFIEMKYNEGEWSLIDGGIVANLTASAKTRLPVCYIFYSELGIVGSVDGKLNFTLNNQKTYDMSGSIGLTLTPTMALGANVAILDVQTGVTGTLNGTLAFPAKSMQEAFKATLTGKVFVKASSPIKFFNASVSYDLGGVELYPNFGAYLDVPKWNMAIEDRVIPTNGQSYEYADTQIVTLSDGRSVMVYITDNGTKTTGNHTTLMYSIYSNGTWSVAQPVCETGRADMSPILRSDGNKAYVVWMNIGKVIDANATESEVYQNTDLWFSELNGDSFSIPERVPNEGNTIMEFSYDLCVANGTAAVVWVENTVNDPFMQSGSNGIYSRVRQNGSWQNITKLISTFDMIGALQSSIIGSNISVQYSDGAKIYTVSGNTATEIGTGNSVKIFDGITYFLRDSQLYSRVNDTVENALGIYCSENYQVYDGNVYWTQQNGCRSELYMQKLGEQNTVQLTYDGGYVSDFSVCKMSDEAVTITYTWYEVNDDAIDTPYGAAYVKTVSGTTIYDLECEDILYDSEQIVADNNAAFHVKILNKSSDIVRNVRMRVKGKNQVVLYNATVLESIAAGEERSVTFEYVLPTNLSGLKLSVEIYSNEIEEVDYNNNIGNCIFSETDLKISEAATESAVIINQGYTVAESVQVKVQVENAFGTVIAHVDAGNLAPGESKTVNYDIPDEYLKFNSVSKEKIFYVSVTSNTQESLMADNYTIVQVEPGHADGIIMEKTQTVIMCGDQVKLKATVRGENAVDRTIHWCSSDTSIATVDDNGLVVAISAGEVDITAIATDGGYTAVCHVTVKEVLKLTNLELSFSKLQLKCGDTAILTYTCEPNVDEEIANCAVWESSNEEIVTVQDGTVFAVGVGIAEITVTLGGLRAICQIEVEKPIKVDFKITEITSIVHNKLEINWTASEGADGYIVYRFNEMDGTYEALKYITDPTVLNYVNSVVCGENYIYKIASYHLNGDNRVILEESEPVSAKALPAAPELQSTNMAAYNKIRIIWTKVNGCEGYVIYRSEAEDGKYSVLKTVTQATATNYVNVVRNSTMYYYKIRAFVTVNGKKIYGDYSNILSGNVISGSPQNFAISQAANGKITFTWDKVEDADGYVIYLYYPDTNKYKAIKNVTDIDVLTYGKKMTKGATYHFAMRAYRLVNGVKVYSDYGEIVSTQ